MKKLSVLILIFAATAASWAVPARKTGIVVTQPDGSEMIVYQNGDEHFHWQTNEKGEWLKLDADGFYRVTKALSTEQIESRRIQSKKYATQQAYPLNVAPRGLVILANFKDVAFQTSKAEMENMLTATNYSRSYTYTYRGKTYKITSDGSARQYFYDSSNGQYNPQFDVIGPVTVSKNMTYYGQNNSNGTDSHPEDLIEEACKLADSNVDFSKYDNDNDGYVDFVFVIYAGYGEADGGAKATIWPHSWYLQQAAGKYCKLDGKIVDLYACGNELDYFSKQHTGIGTFCHEFSHVLGLPDLYETGSPHDQKTLGAWDIMDYGPYNNDGNTPPTFSAYERFFMGWLKPRLITEPENIKLTDLKKSNEALLISTTDQHNLIGNDPNPTTFYMVENRQQTGWDAYLPGHGMMLTKIQYNYSKWAENTVNNSSSKFGVDLIEADGTAPSYDEKNKANGYFGKATDLFPAGANQYSSITNHDIQEITEKNGVIRFKYKGGVEGEEEEEEEEETSIKDVASSENILAIYNILGQKQTTTNVEDLSRGTYIIITASGSKKIVR